MPSNARNINQAQWCRALAPQWANKLGALSGAPYRGSGGHLHGRVMGNPLPFGPLTSSP